MKQFASRSGSRTRSEAWQIIYMDLMTIIMVFFVILWSINQRSDEGVSDSVGDQTQRMVSLPGDVLFPPGKSNMTGKGEEVFGQLFQDDTGAVLSFDTGGLTRRVLVIHGHTDSDGDKAENFELGYKRAVTVYQEIAKYGDVADHVVLCTHADNSPAHEVPLFQGDISDAQRGALREAKAKNRRITIEDQVVSTIAEED